MAASGSSSSSAAKEYDIFISFRGEDTRYNFTSHLVSALSRNSIRAYVDYELEKGDEISSSLMEAIHNSYGSLIVFSENYASSRWCLNELHAILEQRKQGHFIVPVFYNIDPSHVRNQAGSYEKAFAKHEQDPKNKEKLRQWKAALTEAANVVGWDSQTNRVESELVQNIVNDILQKMNHVYQLRESRFVGIDKYCKDIESLLQISLVVGIWGMGGIGKTTIAKVIFDKLSSQYDSCCFLENIREESERYGINHIRNELLFELLKDKNFRNKPKALALSFAMKRLRSKKVLIVLDDVNSFEQLKHLQQECNCLRADSNVIITTRNKHMLAGLEVDYKIYKVEGLNPEQSLQLFKLNAFNIKHPEIGYEEIANQVVGYADGNPLALKVLGSFLRSKSKKEWESALAKLNKVPNDDIQKVLKLSYDALDHEEQEIVLNIAFFFKGEHIEEVIRLLDILGFHGHIGMRNLEDKTLVTVSYHKRVLMHDLIQEMSLDIVRKESIKNPGERSRLCDPKEIYDVLKNNQGASAVEGIILNTSQIKDLPLEIHAFRKMNKLRFLKFYCSSSESCNVHLPQGIELCSNELRYFHWDQFPFHSLSSTFCAEKLVELHMPNSNITKLWDGLQDVINLKAMDLYGCRQLMELPDLSRASKLERVYISWCTNLCHLPPSLLHLNSLIELTVNNCEKLQTLKSESHLKSLRQLSFHGCSNLKEFSLSSEEIVELLFWGTAVDTLPSSLGRCKNLRVLRFCHSLKKMPRKIPKLRSIKVLEIEEVRGLDSSLLRDMFDAFPSLVKLHVTHCDELFQLPDNISILSSLKKLRIESSTLESLPTSIKHLPCLELLHVSYCQRLQSLPDLPPSLRRLEVRYCRSLVTLIPSTALEHFDLEGCVKLDQQSLYYVMAHALNIIKRVQSSPTVCLPGDKVPWWWFSYWTAQRGIRFELPQRSDDLLGFAFCFAASAPILHSHCIGYLRYSETEDEYAEHGETEHECLDVVETRYEHMVLHECEEVHNKTPVIVITLNTRGTTLAANNVYFFSYSLNAKERRAHFHVAFDYDSHRYNLEHGIKGLGVQPICASDLESEFGDKSKRMHSELQADEQHQSPLTKKPKKFQPELELELNTESCTYLNIQGIEIEDSDHENQDEQESFLIHKQIPRKLIFKQLPIESKMLDKNKESFDFLKESEFGDKLKRRWCELEVDVQQQPSLTKKFKEFTLQPVPLELELKLGTKSYKYLEIEGLQVGGYDHEKQDEQEPFCTDKGTLGIEIEDSDHINQDQRESLLIHEKTLRELIFEPLRTKSKMLSYNSETFDFFKESEFGDKLKRCGCEMEGDIQQLSLAKNFKQSTLQLVALGLELELSTRSYVYWEIEGL